MRIIEELLAMLFPPHCPACDELQYFEGFCEHCRAELKLIEGNRCYRCGGLKKECQCKYHLYHFDGITAPYFNEGIAQEAVYNFKFRKRFGCVDEFSNSMAKCVEEAFDISAIDAVCFVPASKKSIAKRGFNQSEEFAKRVAKILKLPLAGDILYKKKSVMTQHELTYGKRFSNVRDGFDTKSRVDGKTLLLVDDIKTTGASLDECARQLKFAGAEKVFCVTALISCKKNQTKI